MSSYRRGDVVVVPFTYTDSEGELVLKKRPGVILKEGPKLIFAIIQITKTNRTDGSTGMMVKRNSQRGMYMGLHFDSFINLGVIKRFHEKEILKIIGTLDVDGMDQLDLMYEDIIKSG